MRGRAASDSRFPTKRQKPPYTSGRGRTLILLGVVAFALLVFLGARAGGDAGRVVSYHGERYERAAVATQDHVATAGVAPTGEKLDGQEVYAERRNPSRILFLLRADGEYDAFVLVDEP